jgi:hypothetical protein
MNQVEPEFRGPFWKHPVFLYLLLTGVLFLFLLGMGWLALDQGWIPDRGISQKSGE